MKLFVQIPCLNEEETLPTRLKAIPDLIDGIDGDDQYPQERIGDLVAPIVAGGLSI